MDSEFKIALVVDMWLTGFDVPGLGTMYIDKPMKAHNLMQAIARVNRVYKDKTAGLIVDYIGLKRWLLDALKTYTEMINLKNEIEEELKAGNEFNLSPEENKKLLIKYNYPPNKSEKAVQTVIRQAELKCKEMME